MRIDNIPEQGDVIDYTKVFKLPAPKKYSFEAAEIQPKLIAQSKALVHSLLGEPNSLLSSEAALRYRHRGSLLITISGAKSGLWYDHESGQGGNLLQLIQNVTQCNFKESLEYAANFLGLKQDNTITSNNNDRSRYANKVYDLSLPITNTLAERYLIEHRKIPSVFSEHIRFMPELWEPVTKSKYPAMVVFAKDINGAIRGMQVTWLDITRGTKLDIEVPKRSYGEIKATMVPIKQGGFSIAVSEGVETALSVASAKPNLTTFAALGSFTNFSQSEIKASGAPLIICSDNDTNNPKTTEIVHKAARELSEKGFNVFLAQPKQTGFDFNDVLKQGGVAEVAAVLDSATLLYPAKTAHKIINVKTLSQGQAKEFELEM